MTVPGRPALFLDRDGVINVDTGYLWRIEECRFVDGIFELTRTMAARGFAVVVVTNQSGIGRGLFTEADFDRLMTYMRDEFTWQGATIDAIYHCPDHPTEGIGRYRRDNSWRKPGPGMLLQAARDLGLDLATSVSIGDKPRDDAAARAAGVGTLIRLDPTVKTRHPDGDVWIVPDLAAALDLLSSRIAG